MEGKIALVTGGSRGLGKDMAIKLAQKGYDIIVTYVNNREMAERVTREIVGMDRKASSLKFDAEKFEELDLFIAQLKEVLQNDFGKDKFDYLINNAGIGATIPFAQVTVEDFDRFMNIHFKTVFFLTQRCLPMMNDNGGIVNVSTGTTRFFVPGYVTYASMKAAIENFTRYVAKEVGNRGIRCNVIAPGPIETDFNNAAIRNNPERKKMMAAQTPLGRVGEASDIGSVVAFLCSDDAGWVNAQRIEVSGGIN